MAEYALQLEGLVKEFTGKRAVDQISLGVRRGEILGLLGPNGAGKTTTIRMVMDIIAPDAGTIRVLGEQFSERMKDRIGYLPEERGLYRKMTVMETLLYLGELKGLKAPEIKSRALDLLKRFQLEGCEAKKIEELSKGMAQKVQFIATTLHSPELLILDEPFSGLDPVNIELVKDIILEKKREGVTIIFSTHLMEYAEMIVDSVAMINQGKKVLDGSLSDLKAQFGKKFLRVDYEGDSSFVAGLPGVHSVRDFGRQMEIELDDLSSKDRLLRELLERVTLHGFQVTEPSLQHIFIQKVREGEQA